MEMKTFSLACCLQMLILDSVLRADCVWWEVSAYNTIAPLHYYLFKQMLYRNCWCSQTAKSYTHPVHDLPHPIKAYILNFRLSPENVSTTNMYRYRPAEQYPPAMRCAFGGFRSGERARVCVCVGEGWCARVDYVEWRCESRQPQ